MKSNQTFKIRDNGESKHGHVKFEWNQIDDDIFVGTNMCCQMHYEQELLDQGITAEVSMEAEKIDSPYGVSLYLWLPTLDHTAPDIDKLFVGVKSIEEMINQGHKVFIHCKNGHGRSPTMAAAWYVYKKGMSAQEAVDFVESRRDEAHIESDQIEQLKQFEEEIS